MPTLKVLGFDTFTRHPGIECARLPVRVDQLLILYGAHTSLLDVEVNPQRPYTFENETLETYLELRYGSEKHIWPMDKVSNGYFTEVGWTLRELLFARLMHL